MRRGLRPVTGLEDEDRMERELELNEREAVVITRERMLEQRIREILKREQVVARKEERIEALLRQLQSMGLHEMATSLEETFQEAIADLKKDVEAQGEAKRAAKDLPDGGAMRSVGDLSLLTESGGEPIYLDLIDEPGLDPEVRAQRFLEHLARELDRRERGEVWDKADRMRYLAETFQTAGNHAKAAEYARRALTVLAHFV